MNGLFDWLDYRDPDNPPGGVRGYQRPLDSGLWISPAPELGTNILGASARAATLLRDQSGRVPNGYPGEKLAGLQDDFAELLRTFSQHQDFFRARAVRSLGNGYASLYNLLHHPIIAVTIARWRMEVTEITATTPITIRVRRNSAAYSGFLSTDRISRAGRIQKYFATPSDTHGFGNATENYTRDGIGIAAGFSRWPVALANDWGRLLNDAATGGRGEIRYLKVIDERTLELYNDAALQVPSSVGWTIPTQQELYANGPSMIYAPSVATGDRCIGQVAHVELLGGGFKEWSGDPVPSRLWSSTRLLDPSLYPRARRFARVVESKAPGGSFATTATDLGASAFAPAISVATDGGRVSGAAWDPVFSGLFADCGAGYGEGRQGDGANFLDQHVLELSDGAAHPDEAGDEGTAPGGTRSSDLAPPPAAAPPASLAISRIDSTSRDVVVTFAEPVSWTAGLDTPVAITGAGLASGNAFFRDQINGQAWAMRQTSPTTALLYWFDGTGAPRQYQQNQSFRLTGGRAVVGGADTPMAAPIDGENSGGLQAWPSHRAPSSVNIEMVHEGRETISLNFIKRRVTSGARGYKITFEYANLDADEWRPFDTAIKKFKGQWARFKIPLRGYARGAIPRAFASSPATFAAWEGRSIYPSREDTRPGDSVLDLTGFDGGNPGIVARAGDLVAPLDPGAPPGESRFLEVAKDAESNRFGEAALVLASPVKRAVSSSLRVVLIDELDFLHGTIDTSSVSYSWSTAGLVSFSVGFHVVA